MHVLRNYSCRGAASNNASEEVKSSHLFLKASEEALSSGSPLSWGPRQEGGRKWRDLAGRIFSQAAQHVDTRIDFLSCVQLDAGL